MLAVVIAGCKSSQINDEPENDVDFCSCVNTENIDKTIPVINDFLYKLSDELDEEQKFLKLIEWLKSHTCLISVELYGHLCMYSEQPMSKILISFDENEITKEIILDISMKQPLEAVGYDKE